jgi:hypothetical protein
VPHHTSGPRTSRRLFELLANPEVPLHGWHACVCLCLLRGAGGVMG